MHNLVSNNGPILTALKVIFCANRCFLHFFCFFCFFNFFFCFFHLFLSFFLIFFVILLFFPIFASLSNECEKDHNYNNISKCIWWLLKVDSAGLIGVWMMCNDGSIWEPQWQCQRLIWNDREQVWCNNIHIVSRCIFPVTTRYEDASDNHGHHANWRRSNCIWRFQLQSKYSQKALNLNDYRWKSLITNRQSRNIK